VKVNRTTGSEVKSEDIKVEVFDRLDERDTGFHKGFDDLRDGVNYPVKVFVEGKSEDRVVESVEDDYFFPGVNSLDMVKDRVLFIHVGRD
jgi:hypothetical protein